MPHGLAAHSGLVEMEEMEKGEVVEKKEELSKSPWRLTSLKLCFCVFAELGCLLGEWMVDGCSACFPLLGHLVFLCQTATISCTVLQPCTVASRACVHTHTHTYLSLSSLSLIFFREPLLRQGFVSRPASVREFEQHSQNFLHRPTLQRHPRHRCLPHAKV